ncbi:MAG: hypothetical protein JWO10_1465 [Microbacteriaceae bacterium]|nr:hypothetical protein [Microbacteriaceae bacterium]
MTEPTIDERPAPGIDDLTRPYWDSAARGELSIQFCDRCARYNHAPSPLCPTCHRSDALGWRAVSGRGTVYSTVVTHGSRMPGFATGSPYLVAMVELVEQPGLYLFANVTGSEPHEVNVGDAVEVHFDDHVGDVTIPQFRLV